MKKLMVGFAAVALACVAQSATCTWGSGAIYAPTATGTFGSKTVAQADLLVNASIFHLTSTEYEALIGATFADTQANIWKAYQTAEKGTGFENAYMTAQNINASTGTKIAAISAKEAATYSAGDSVYGVIIFETTDAAGNDWYLANMANYTWGDGSNKSFTFLASKQNGTGSAIDGWTTAVPEPTSGLLLLLGMAGLALRRRRA